MSRYSIGEVARLTGLSRDTLRYYEKLGLLEQVARDSGGRRFYGKGHLSVLRFIRRAQGMGFSLEEIGQLLQFRRDPVRARREVRELTRRKLLLVEEQLQELQALRDEMRLLLNLCGCAEEEEGCPIIDALERQGPGS
ncbi:MAG TPA: heavy metal-responsive transcriptional regulator [Thiolapillus brandeum]|uniref:Heavy metal-responsive transcriptional regulator n=1 Tax=Thiolapillus brandeum TaxID=1076588 RepID=A0A7C5IZ33_9GAMM|nr:heavy metal-responsive transcriptional regulator [Thiolapillus brandeum]